MTDRRLISVADFLLPKMEFFPIGKQSEGTPVGVLFKELDGEALLEFKEYIEQMKQAEGEASELNPAQALNLMAKFIMLSACDESGNNIFSENDIPKLAKKDPNLLLEMANFSMELSGLKVEAINEVAVNLPKDQPVSSISDLPTNSINQ